MRGAINGDEGGNQHATRLGNTHLMRKTISMMSEAISMMREAISTRRV